MIKARSSLEANWRRVFVALAMLVAVGTNISGGIIRPPIHSLQVQLKPAQPVVVPPVIQRTLPPITHPELLRSNPQPHIFVKTSPNRAFRPGEQVLLTVNAFDAKTGAQLDGAPVTIDIARGVTGRPIPLTIGLTMARRCGSMGGQPFCLNVLTPPSGQVMTPVNQFPGGGGAFTLSVVRPTLLVGVAGSPVLRPGTATFTVSAVDARTRQPVAGAEVLVNGKSLGPANRPITYTLNAAAPLRATSRLGLETLPASFGPILIVRAPGYSDEIVHYVLSMR
ncbi:MAG: hypothetical protein DMG38_23230 [Acidobacteria bacterium]|nr:MAG: hypothetical protein DMG38_23230 [Acidobacteriota bacterium]